MRRTAQKIIAEYGAIGVIVYFAIFFATWGGFWAAFRAGWHPSSVGGGAGTVAAAYIATKLTQPLRIAATIGLTPLIARGRRKPAADVVTVEQPPETTGNGSIG
jgi:hypothetical protein